MLADADHPHAVDPAGLAVDDEPYPLAERTGGLDHIGGAAMLGNLNVAKAALPEETMSFWLTGPRAFGTMRRLP